MAGWDLLGRLWTLGRKVEDLLDLQAKTLSALQAVEVRLRSVEERMTYLDAGQGQLIVEARAAAGAASTAMAGAVISDVVTRVTRIKMRQDEIHRRLPPPA